MRNEVYGQLTDTEHKAEQYQCFIENENLDKKLIKFYSQSSTVPILGDDAFINSLALVKPSTEVPRDAQAYMRPSISAVISAVALMFGKESSELIIVKKGRGKPNIPRKMAIYIARKYGDHRLQALADTFGLQHYGGISFAVHAFAKEVQKDLELERCINSVVKKLGVQV